MSFMLSSQLCQIRCIEGHLTDYHQTLTLGYVRLKITKRYSKKLPTGHYPF